MTGETLSEPHPPMERPIEPVRSRRRRRSAHRKQPLRDRNTRIALGVFGVHLIVAPMLLGGIHPWAMVIIAASALASLAASVIAAASVLPSRAPLVVWVAMALLGWTALQAAPLPCSLVRVMAPQAAEQAAATELALGAAPASFCAVSRDPGGTRQEIMKGVAIVSTLLAAWLLAANGVRNEVFALIAGSSLLMSLVALAHGILRLDVVFGLYKPAVIGRKFLLAPLMNINNLGAFAALGAPIWLGLTHRHHVLEVRWLGYVAVAITTATALLSLSRGAIGQVVASLVVMVALLAWDAKRRRPSWRRSGLAPAQGAPPRELAPNRLGIVVTIAAAVGFATYVAGGSVTTEFANSDFSKLKLAFRTIQFAGQTPLLGVGRGAFSAAFVAVEGRDARFVFAENFFAQWLSEWGFPMTLLWCAVVGIALLRALRNQSSLATLGAATALLAITAQNLVDLGFEILGVAVTVAALLGALVAPEKPGEPVKLRASNKLAVGVQLMAGLLALGLLGPTLPGTAVPELVTNLRDSLQKSNRARFRTVLQSAVTLHPSEPKFAVLAATEALAHGDRSIGRWINRGMQLAPKWSAPHVLAFEWLWSRGRREQALVELRLAAQASYEPQLVLRQVCRLARLDGEYVLTAAPHAPTREAFLQMATTCIEDDHRSAPVIDEALMREFPNNTLGFERTANRLAKHGRTDEGLAMLERVIARQPTKADSARITRANLLVGAGMNERAIERLAEDVEHAHPSRTAVLLMLRGLAYAGAGDVAGVRATVLEYRRAVGDTAPLVAASYGLEGRLELQLGNTGTALAAYREAFRINQDSSYLIQIASIARQLRDRRLEIWALMRLCELEPAQKSFCTDRDRLLHSADPERRR